MISVFFLLWALLRRSTQVPARRYRKWPDICVLGIGLYLLHGSDSSTSLATLIVGVVALLAMGLLRKVKLMIPQIALGAVVILLIMFGTSSPFLSGSYLSSFTSTFNRDPTLTGRTEIWRAVVPAVQSQPFLGSGFGSFWTDARRKQYDIPTAHNGYLDILLEFGGVGLVLYTVWLLSSARKLHCALRQDYDWAAFAICLLIMGLIYNNTESTLNSLPEQMTTVVVLASLVVPARLSRRALTRWDDKPLAHPSNRASICS
jgi:O-antigen ligase